MGNNNTSDIKEEDNAVDDAAEKAHLEDQRHPTATSEYADTKTAEIVSVDTIEPEKEISQEDTHEDCDKEENQNTPTSDEYIVLENEAKASHDTPTFELGNDAPAEDIHTDDLKEKIQTIPTDEGKDVEEKAELPASDHIESLSENDPFKGDTHARDTNMESQKHPSAEDEDVQEKATRRKHEKDSLEGDTFKEDVNVNENPTTEGTDIQEMDARLDLDDEASDPKNYITQETELVEKSIILESDFVFNNRGKEILEVGVPEESPKAESGKSGGEKCQILSSSSLEGSEDCGTESCLKENLLVTDHHHLESQHKQEEEETKVSTLDSVDISDKAELQESPVVDSNHKELIKVLPESSSPSESWPKADFLDTNPLCPQDDDDEDDVIKRETQIQEKNISSDKSEVSDKDEPKSSLEDESVTESDSSSGIKSNDIDNLLLTKVNNIITDDSLNSLSESVSEANSLMHDFEENHKVLHEEVKMSRSGSEKENSHEVEGSKATEEERDNYKKKIEEIYKEPEDSHATENGFEGTEKLEQSNSHLVTTEHVESSDSLLDIYSYQEDSEDQIKTSDWKQENHDEATSTNSVSENVTIFSQIQKSPSFNLNLQNGESSEETDQSPLLSIRPDHSEEMPVEEKIVTMERSYTEKSDQAPLLLCYSREDDEASLLASSSEEQGNHVGTYNNAVKEETSNSPKQKEEKRKSKTMSSFFINCMCCATVAN